MPVHQQYGSYYRVFVSPVQGILTAGSTYNLAAGQVGIFDGNTYQALTAPSYFQNKSIIIAQGQNPQKLPLMMGIPNNFSEKAENVFGNRITQWRGYRGHIGQSELVAIGYDGSDATKTLTMRKNEKRHLWILLTGAPINKMYSTNGLMLKYTVDSTDSGDCCDGDCSDCDPIDCNLIADNLVNRINKDQGIMRHNGLIRAFKKTYCTTAPATPAATWNIFTIVVPDDGSEGALGRVQAQYPGYPITRLSRTGTYSTYQMYRIMTASPATPAVLSTSISPFIPNCPACPAGYTTVAGAHMYEMTSPTLPALTNQVGTPLKLAELGTTSTYLVAVALTRAISATLPEGEAVTGAQIRYLNDVGPSCTLTTPTTIAWTDAGDAITFPQTYHITLKDPECGTPTDWLTTLNALYVPAYSSTAIIALATLPASGTCTRTYELIIQSQPLVPGCTQDQATWKQPPGFMGISWQVYYPTPAVTSGCSCGVWIEAAYVNRITNACTYGTFDYNADGIHIQVSNLDPDYNSLPGIGEDWPIQHLRRFMQPTGLGAALQHLEERSKELFLKRWSYDIAVRDAYGFVLFADPNTYYDQYALSFDQLKVNQSGFTDGSVNRHTLNVYYPVGLGKAYEDAINSYVASSPGLGIEPVALLPLP